MRKTPRLARFFGPVMVGVLMSASAYAQSSAPAEEVSVSEAVRAALSRPPAELLLERRLDAARAGVDEQTRRSAPTLSLGYERVGGSTELAASEFSAVVEQNFDLSRWRSRLRQGLTHRERAERAEHERWRLETAHRVRVAFYEVRFHQARLAELERWRARLEDALQAMRARVARGDASAYMSGRIARELELAAASEAAVRSALEGAWAELTSHAGWDEQPELGGALEPSEEGDAAEPHSPEQAILQARIQALGAEIDAVRSPWLRDWTVGVGYRQDRAGALTGHGVIVALSLPLALWNPDAPRQARLQAERTALQHELELVSQQYERALEGAKQRRRVAMQALRPAEDAAADAALTRQALQAFEAGESSLAELLDVYESELELQLARIELQWEARRADLDLQRLQGVGASR